MPTVLLVEPNESLRALTSRHLTLALSPVEVVPAPDVARGLALLREASWDALVVACELPDDGAFVLLAAASALARPPHIVVTSVEPVSPAEMERCLSATWLLKPYRLEELEECIAAALRSPPRPPRTP
jgi:DNA-binding response OmpR family regulator